MIELYHIRDGVCPFKVRIALAEKGLEWVSRLQENLRDPEYLKLNPNGYVPTLVHDGNVLLESRIISEYLDEAFPDPPLMPEDPLGRHRARFWSKQVDDTLHLNIFILTFCALGGWGLGKVPEADRMKRLPKEAIKRQITLDLLRDDLSSQWVEAAIARFRRLVTEMDAALRQGPWLAGDRFSLADIDLSVYIHRLGQMDLDVLWEDLPALKDWYARVSARPSFKAGILDWITAAEKERYAINASGVRKAVIAWLERQKQAA